MQLPPQDELVLVSSLPPIRAKKLKYFEDANFTSRILPVPDLGKGPRYPDCPPARPNDWGTQERGQHLHLAADTDGAGDTDEGGRAQERVPGDEVAIARPDLDVPESIDGDDSFAGDTALDRLRQAATIRAHGVNEGDKAHDILPAF